MESRVNSTIPTWLMVALGLSACGPICKAERTKEGSWGTPTCQSDEGPAGAPARLEGDELDGGVDG